MTLNELLHKQRLTIPGVGVLLAYGKDVPSVGESGYSWGCLFFHMVPAANTPLWINKGDVSSCNFLPVDC